MYSRVEIDHLEIIIALSETGQAVEHVLISAKVDKYMACVFFN